MGRVSFRVRMCDVRRLVEGVAWFEGRGAEVKVGYDNITVAKSDGLNLEFFYCFEDPRDFNQFYVTVKSLVEEKGFFGWVRGQVQGSDVH